MSNAFSALPEAVLAAPRAGAAGLAAALARAVRFARLLLLLIVMWSAAASIAPWLARRRRQALARRWAEKTLRVLAIEVVRRGGMPPSDGPVLWVANHVSWLDNYALQTASDARFVGKSEIRGWPLIGTIARGFGTIFLRRGSVRDAWRAKNAAADVLRAGEPVAVFPEGTTTEGDRLLRFHPAFFQAAIDSGSAVQPVAVRYRSADGGPTAAAAYVGDMSVLESLARILREPSLSVELVACRPIETRGRARREVAALAHAAIADALDVEPAAPEANRAGEFAAAS